MFVEGLQDQNPDLIARFDSIFEPAAAFFPGAVFHVAEPRLENFGIQFEFGDGDGRIGIGFGEDFAGWVDNEGFHVVAGAHKKNVIFNGTGAGEDFAATPNRKE